MTVSDALVSICARPKSVMKSLEFGVRSAELKGSSECGVRSAECGVWSVECGVRSAECGMGMATWGGANLSPSVVKLSDRLTLE